MASLQMKLKRIVFWSNDVWTWCHSPDWTKLAEYFACYSVDTWNMFVNVLKLRSCSHGISSLFWLELCTKIHSALTMLDKNNLIKYDKRTGQVQAGLFLWADSDVWGLFWLDKMWILMNLAWIWSESGGLKCFFGFSRWLPLAVLPVAWQQWG